MPNTLSESQVKIDLAEFAAEWLEHVNHTYEDSLLLVVRILGGKREATEARAIGRYMYGLDFIATDAEGDHAVRVLFDTPLTDVDQVTEQAFALVMKAREESGEPGETTAEVVARGLTGIRTFVTSVKAVADVNENLRRITFAGGDLLTFHPLGPDTFLYVLLPPEGRDQLTVDASFTWDHYQEMPEAERPVGVYYTLREWRPDAPELDMLFVLHEPAGPASGWAARAKPGDQVALWGPREAFHPPADTKRFLLVADETGLPAVARILETMTDDQTAVVVAEVAGPDQQQQLLQRDGIEVHWVHRAGTAAGTVPGLLADKVRDVAGDAEGTYAWGGGESRSMTAVRKYLRREAGWQRENVAMVAYWRHADSPIDTDEG